MVFAKLLFCADTLKTEKHNMKHRERRQLGNGSHMFGNLVTKRMGTFPTYTTNLWEISPDMGGKALEDNTSSEFRLPANKEARTGFHRQHIANIGVTEFNDVL